MLLRGGTVALRSFSQPSGISGGYDYAGGPVELKRGELLLATCCGANVWPHWQVVATQRRMRHRDSQATCVVCFWLQQRGAGRPHCACCQRHTTLSSRQRRLRSLRVPLSTLIIKGDS